MDTDILRKLYRDHFGDDPDIFLPLAPAGSNRKYFRLGFSNKSSAIGTFNDDIFENKAFIGFSSHFRLKGLPVPEIFNTSVDFRYYLQQDCGDTSLKDMVDKMRSGNHFPDLLTSLYKKSLTWLIKFQTQGHLGLNYSLSFPRESFDARSILWDLNHFKYFFLKLTEIPYHENLLEDDFEKLTCELNLVDREYFMFRDFQSRNIMISDAGMYFIDFQGGRKGSLYYDLASLLFEGRTNIPSEQREDLFNYYYSELKRNRIVVEDKASFRRNYLNFALIRQLQALGAYGLRGLIQKKTLFLQSIPYAIRNLELISREIGNNMLKYPELHRIIQRISTDKKFINIIDNNIKVLTVKIFSFSYKKGIPDDYSGHGGGFVFDCRHISNPGKLPKYNLLNGLDSDVESYFREKTIMPLFLENIFSIIDSTIESYVMKNYTFLQVSFGCTGGQHRSVYAAQKLSEHLKNKGVNIVLEHRELIQ